MSYLIEKLAQRVSRESRKKKFGQFLSFCVPNSNITILDVGVNTEEYSEADNYLERYYPYPQNITAVGIEDMTSFEKRYPQVKTIQGTGLNLTFPDNSFDICYSNAVIEHVGDINKQLQFLSELYRVGRRGYLTTPNRFFPIEIHTRIPLLHLFLSKKSFDAFLTRIGKAWAAGEYMHLLSEKELRSILQKANITNYTFIKNRFLGFPMTFTIIWTKI